MLSSAAHNVTAARPAAARRGADAAGRSVARTTVVRGGRTVASRASATISGAADRMNVEQHSVQSSEPPQPPRQGLDIIKHAKVTRNRDLKAKYAPPTKPSTALAKKIAGSLAVVAVVVCFSQLAPAFASEAVIAEPVSAFSAADTCWILISTALVLFMTIPGLSAFYAGIVKRKNMLSVLMQCFALTSLMSIMWFAVGYSLSFSATGNPFIGGLDKVLLMGVTKLSLWETIPEALWALYQMTFAIITPALMVGSFVERMKFNAVMWYAGLWMFAVYFPFCHMVWGPGGFLAAKGVLDFAGGIVVHITAGIGALVGAAVLGPRKDNRMVAGNLVLTVLGTGMLWVGWYGFNGGSALTASADAAFAALATQLAAATAAATWMLQDVFFDGKASMLGIATGSIAGLATVTPAAGFIGPGGAVILGVVAGVVCRYFSLHVKEKFQYDDSLDVFGVHGIGGFLGTCLLGIVASPVLGGFNTDTTMLTQTVLQVSAAVGCAAYTALASYICLVITKAIVGGDLRVPEGEEVGQGLDKWCHGETCYSLEEAPEEISSGQPATGTPPPPDTPPVTPLISAAPAR